jgi:hypothetical protein
VTRIDGMTQSGPDPKGLEHALNAVLPQRGLSPANQDEK